MRADRDEMALQLSAQEAGPDTALDRLAERDVALRALLDEVGVAGGDRTTVRATVAEVMRYDRETETEVRIGYRADAATRIRLRDQTLAGVVMREATARVGAQVQGPWWRIAPDDPARLEACRLAVADANRRAEAYADAAGLSLGPVTAIVDAGARPPEPRGKMLAGADALSAVAPAVTVASGELEVAAAVEVTFEVG
ncbi:MAG: SIMPL domain-containing protein [Actinomycetota bacterium]